MTKMILIVGFLGSGKTTMMQEILKKYKDRKVGVIVNEFGEVNIDAKIIDHDGIKIAELSNGSIFCACIKDKFVDSLIEMSGRDLDYLFIEASGLADPANISQILEGIRAKVADPYDYRGSICIVDGENFLDLYEVLPAIKSQIEFSMAVIINKGDLVEESTLGEVTEKISAINPKASSYVTSYCNVDTKEIVDNLAISETQARDTVNTAETRPTTFVLRGKDTVPMDNLKKFIEDISGSTYRVKGFVKTDKGDMEVSSVGKNIQITPWEKGIEQTALTAISSVGFKLMSVITKAIDENVKGYIQI